MNCGQLNALGDLSKNNNINVGNDVQINSTHIQQEYENSHNMAWK